MSGGELFVLVFGWVMIVEGLMPFIDPAAWQRAAEAASKAPPEKVRLLGGILLIMGLVLVWMMLR